MPRVPTLTKLANALEVSDTTLGRWRRTWSGFPKKKKGGWDPEEVRKWRDDQTAERAKRKRINSSRARKRGRPPDLEAGSDVQPIRDPDEQGILFADDEKVWAARFRKAKAKQEELRYEQMRGDLVPRTEVETMFANRVHEVTSKLDAMGRSLAPQLHGLTAREIEARINEHCRSIRQHFARAKPIG